MVELAKLTPPGLAVVAELRYSSTDQVVALRLRGALPKVVAEAEIALLAQLMASAEAVAGHLVVTSMQTQDLVGRIMQHPPLKVLLQELGTTQMAPQALALALAAVAAVPVLLLRLAMVALVGLLLAVGAEALLLTASTLALVVLVATASAA